MAGQRERRSTVAIGDAVELNETARVVSGRLWVDVISGGGGGGGTQYPEGTVVTPAVGNVILWEDVGDTFVTVSAGTPLPVNIVAGSSSGVQYAEDTAHVSGDLATMAGVVQQTADAALSSDGDRSLLQVDASGYLKVNVKAGAAAGTEYTDGDADATPTGTVALGFDGANVHALTTDGAGDLQVDVLTSALPAGAATAALQLPDGHNVTVDNAAGAAAVNIQDGGNAITVDGTVAATQSGAWSVTADTELPAAAALGDADANPTTPRIGADLQVWNGSAWYRAGGSAANGLEVDITRIAAGNNNIGNVDIVSLPDEGQQTMANSISVAIASDQGAIPVSGTVSVTEPVSVDDNGGSLTIDALALPLPTGAATSALQLPDGHNVTVDNAAGAAAVNIQDGGNTITVDAASLPLPTGAATAANQVTEIASLSVLDDWDETDRAKVNSIVGQAGVQGGSGVVSASTQRVVLATDVALPAGTNNIGDVDILSLPNEGQQTMANSISVALASDQAARYSVTTLTNVNTVYDASPTSATSDAVACTDFRKFMFSYEVVKSAGTPTDIQFFMEYNNGATWCQYRNDFWGQLLYDDVATATALKRAHSGDCVGASMRVRVVAAGTGASASFTVSNARLELKN